MLLTFMKANFISTLFLSFKLANTKIYFDIQIQIFQLYARSGWSFFYLEKKKADLIKIKGYNWKLILKFIIYCKYSYRNSFQDEYSLFLFSSPH